MKKRRTTARKQTNLEDINRGNAVGTLHQKGDYIALEGVFKANNNDKKKKKEE
jgi:hypothetical protein